MSAGVRSHQKGLERITSLNTVKSLTVPSGAIFALIQPLTQAVWLTNDGSTPSATNGIQIAVGTILEYDADLEKVRLLEAAASSDV